MKKLAIFVSVTLLGLIFAFFVKAATEPVSLWKFDGYGNPTIIDFVDGNHGELHEGVRYSSIGVENWGVEFDGEGGYIEAPHNDVWNFNGDFAIETWVKFTDPKDSHILSHNINGGSEGMGAQPHDGWYVKLLNGTLYFGGIDHTGTCSQAPHSNWQPEWNTGIEGLNDDAWHQIVLTRSGNTLYAYKDGQLGASIAMSCNPVHVAAPLRMGVSGLESGTNYHGLMDEVSIYHSALKAKEIKKSYNQKYPNVQTVMIWPYFGEEYTVQSGQLPVVYWGWHDCTKGVINDYLEALDTLEYRLDGNLILNTKKAMNKFEPIQKSWKYPVESCGWDAQEMLVATFRYELKDLTLGDHTLQTKYSTAYPILNGVGESCVDENPEIPGCVKVPTAVAEWEPEPVTIHVVE